MSAALQHATGRLSGVGRVLRNARDPLLLGMLPALFLCVYLGVSFHRGSATAWAIDFNGNLRTPAHEILDGVSPYHSALLAHVRAAVAAGRSPVDFQHGVFAAYPAPALLLGVPFTFLPAAVAEWLWVLCSLAAGGLALRLLGVRDWRVYGAVALMPVVETSLMLGGVDLLLMLGLAAAWRWRDHTWRAGAALGAMIALKLVALPLIVWLVATRRYRAAAAALAVATGLCLGGWALIGFHGLRGYPHLLSLLTDIEGARGYSLVHYAGALGLPGALASAAPYVVGGCLLAAVCAVARRGSHADETAFLLGVLAVLAFSPIVWQHYLVLMLVPLAILRPGFSVIWLVPSLLWLTPDSSNVARPRELVMFALVLVAIVVRALTQGRAGSDAPLAPALAGSAAL